MRPLRTLYHFLGGVRFAIILIAATALFVIAGTLIESRFQSHRYAALFTYDNFLFGALLWGFFVNILFAATRRWPFRFKHIPFLITHLGLLMILAGTIAKRHYGLQGSMVLVEGTGSDFVSLPDTYAVALHCKSCGSKHLFPLKTTWRGERISRIGSGPDGVSIRMTEFFPHASSYLATWVKGPNAYITGLAPLPMETLSNDSLPQPGGKVRFYSKNSPVWNLYAIKTENAAETVDALAYGGVDRPFLAILEDQLQDVTLAAVGQDGSSWTSVFKKDGLEQLIAYDDGYGGYSVRVEMPLAAKGISDEEWSEAVTALIERQLMEADLADFTLSPPLSLLREGCRLAGQDFPSVARMFLMEWDRSGKWLLPNNQPLPKSLQKSIASLPWETIPQSDFTGCQLAARLNEYLGEELSSGEDPIAVLKKHGWPLADSLEKQIELPDSPPPLVLLARQIFLAAQLLPEAEPDFNTALNGTLLSAYMSANGITWNSIMPEPDSPEIAELVMDRRVKEDPSGGKIVLETPIAQIFTAERPSRKLEDNIPMATVQISQGKRAQRIRLGYDKTGSGLKWPALDGAYLLRLQSDERVIPYRLRLRQARQINYANSNQPYSYESDLIITDKHSGKVYEKTISMNKVHETPEGYRFYLSSISSQQENSIKQVTIVVNYDPAKYWLTYPGAAIMSLGIILLFAMRPYRWQQPQNRREE